MSALLHLWPLITPVVLLVAGFLVYGVRAAIVGADRTPRLGELEPSPLLPRVCLEYGYVLYRLPVSICFRLGITADMLTLASLGLTLSGALAIARGWFGLGGWTLIAAFTCDALDGVVARASGTASVRGEYIDSVVDHYSDLVAHLGFIYYYRNDLGPLLLVAGAMTGSALVTFTRTKGASLGVDPRIGVMRRFERTVWLGGGTVLSPIVAALIEPVAPHPRHHAVIAVMAILLVLTHLTVVQRVRFVVAALRRTRTRAG